MTTEIKEQQLSLNGITGVSSAVGISQMSAGAVPPTAPAPAGKLPEGWHSTERYRGYVRFAVREGMGCQDYRH